MTDILFTNARILTLAHGDVPRRGEALGNLSVIANGSVLVRGDRIAAVTDSAQSPPTPAQSPPTPVGGKPPMHIDAAGRVLMPAFIDCHTHACWAGERFDEFELKLRGANYLDILKAGGGIMSTVRAVRSATEDDLVELLQLRLARMAALGTAVVEVKSGYGLNTETELKMLRAIHRAAQHSPLHVIPTFLGAHAIDPDNPNFIDQTINETLPAVVAEFPGITCDAYCESGRSTSTVRCVFMRISSTRWA
jgi:imidazolonepropionase